MIVEKGSQISMYDGWLHMTAKSQDDRLVGRSSSCGRSFYLNCFNSNYVGFRHVDASRHEALVPDARR